MYMQQKYYIDSMNNKNRSSVQQSQITNQTELQGKRIPFKMVRSTFEPPEQTEASYNYVSDKKSEVSRKSKQLLSKQIQMDNQSHYSYGNNNNFNPSIEFISSLVSIRQMVNFDEGDCIPLESDDRWVIMNGEVKVVGVNGCFFNKKEGFVFFASIQTKRKIKQIVAVTYTSAVRIPQNVFKQNVRNYIYVKNSQKIKFLKFCPFLTWTQSLSEDIAIAMEFFEPPTKDATIYKEGEESNYIYFVKQGIILLQRIGKAGNQIILDFQRHYQTSYLSEEEGLIIVRKGMLFGADGILIKQINNEISLLESQNPELQESTRPYEQKHQTSKLKSTRIYTAKSIGKCELYRIDKNVLQTYLKNYGHSLSGDEQIHITNKQLDRICLEYTNLLMGSRSITKQVKNKKFQFKISMDETMINQLQKKRKKVEEIKTNENRIKRISNINSQERKNQPNREQQQFPFKFTPKKKKDNENRQKDVSLPSLNNRKYVENLIMKKLSTKEGKQTKQAKQYIGYKKKIENMILGKDYKESKLQKQTEINLKNKNDGKRTQNLQFINVKSYRSLLSSLS